MEDEAGAAFMLDDDAELRRFADDSAADRDVQLHESRQAAKGMLLIHRRAENDVGAQRFRLLDAFLHGIEHAGERRFRIAGAAPVKPAVFIDGHKRIGHAVERHRIHVRFEQQHGLRLGNPQLGDDVVPAGQHGLAGNGQPNAPAAVLDIIGDLTLAVGIFAVMRVDALYTYQILQNG
jgi:hypothetical protein